MRLARTWASWVRRTVLAVVAILVLCVPFAVFALINHEVAASSWAAWAGFTALVTYVVGGPARRVSDRRRAHRAGPDRARRRGRCRWPAPG